MTASEDYVFVTSESICVAFANVFVEVAVVALLAVEYVREELLEPSVERA
jgi:hypothetical protein